jgi:hypothetical protein
VDQISVLHLLQDVAVDAITTVAPKVRSAHFVSETNACLVPVVHYLSLQINEGATYHK